MLNAQLAPAATAALHVVVLEKGPEMAMPERFNGPFPVFINVTVCAAVVPPTDCLPKGTLVGLSVTAGVRIPLPVKLKEKEGAPGASV